MASGAHIKDGGLFALFGQSWASAWYTSQEVGMKFQQVTQLLVLSLQTQCPPSEAAMPLVSPQGGGAHRRCAGPCCPAAQLNPRPVPLIFPWWRPRLCVLWEVGGPGPLCYRSRPGLGWMVSRLSSLCQQTPKHCTQSLPQRQEGLLVLSVSQGIPSPAGLEHGSTHGPGWSTQFM